jgi:hypothetical protein
MENTNIKWAVIKDFPNYRVSTTGIVMSMNYRHTKKPGYLAPLENGCGYLQVQLLGGTGEKKQARKLISRLVAEAFIENPDNLPEVNHKDLNKYNNNVENLEWITRIDNGLHCGRGKLTFEDACLIDWWVAQGISQTDTAYQFGISVQTVNYIVNKKTWKSVPKHYNLRDTLRHSGLVDPWPKRSNINPKPKEYCSEETAPTPNPIHFEKTKHG